MILLVEEELDAARNISRDELESFFNDYIAPSAPRRRKLVVRSLALDGARIGPLFAHIPGF